MEFVGEIKVVVKKRYICFFTQTIHITHYTATKKQRFLFVGYNTSLTELL